MSVRDVIMEHAVNAYWPMDETAEELASDPGLIRDRAGSNRHLIAFGAKGTDYDRIVTPYGRAGFDGLGGNGRANVAWDPFPAVQKRTFIVAYRRESTPPDAAIQKIWGYLSAYELIWTVNPHRIALRAGSDSLGNARCNWDGPVPENNKWTIITCSYIPSSDQAQLWVNDTDHGVQTIIADPPPLGQFSIPSIGDLTGNSYAFIAVLDGSVAWSAAKQRRLIFGLTRDEKTDGAARTFTPKAGLDATLDGSGKFGDEGRDIDFGAVIARGGITTSDIAIQEALESSGQFDIT